jgi:hypothetical protein
MAPLSCELFSWRLLPNAFERDTGRGTDVSRGTDHQISQQQTRMAGTRVVHQSANEDFPLLAAIPRPAVKDNLGVAV